MRSPVVLLLVVVSLVAGLLPCYRCTPTEGAGCGATVVVGSHAHRCDGHHHESEGNEPGTGEGGSPSRPERDSDRGPCCVHEASDPVAPPNRQVTLDLHVVSLAPAIVHDPAPSRVTADVPEWRVPQRRAPTETVVLLR